MGIDGRQYMPRHLKLYKSGGVPVTGAIYRLMLEANSARDQKDWQTAARGYQAVTDLDPELVHVWLQLGHALKETHRYGAAESAYKKAAALQPQSAEPHLQLGHLYKLQGQIAPAGQAYLRSAQLDPLCADAIQELHAIAGRGIELSANELIPLLPQLGASSHELIGPDFVMARAYGAVGELQGVLAASRSADDAIHAKIKLLQTTLDDIGAELKENGENSADRMVTFDVSDLISYFRDARLPTGIQRVQIEVISAALQVRGTAAAKVCCFSEHRDTWVEVPAYLFQHICKLSLAGGDRAAPEWAAARVRLVMLLNLASPMIFEQGAVLVNLGTSWWLQNYFLMVRDAKAKFGIRYVPFVHDLIPVVAAEHCTPALTQDFITWLMGVFEHADAFLTNSEATKRDLLAVAERIGVFLSPDKIGVILLDADFRKPGLEPAGEFLTSHGLNGRPFVLFVSTVESRKNHLCALDAWSELARRKGIQNVPKLVCVGNRGWLNDAVYARLKAQQDLQDSVLMLSSVSDTELAALYKGCIFTIYPSLYEGWGLPVTEALCYGKVPVLSDRSSLPEAGGPFGVYIDPYHSSKLADAAERLTFDAKFRKQRETEIAGGFKPRTWWQIADQIGSVVSHATETNGTAGPALSNAPMAVFGAYHPLVRNFETHIWRGMRAGEVFRSGSGWWGPDDWGCWTRPKGGDLSIGLPLGHGPLKLYLQLHGYPGSPSRYRLEVGTRRVAGILQPDEFKWVGVDVPAARADCTILTVSLRGESSYNLAERTNGTDSRQVSVGVAGFMLLSADDAGGRAQFLEAVSLGNIMDLAFNRQPVDYMAMELEPATAEAVA